DENGIYPVQYSDNLKVVSIGMMLPEEDAPVIWRGSLKHKALQQFLEEVEWWDLDFLIVDLPPGTGDEPLSIVQLIKDVTGIVIVVTPQEVALLDAKKAINFSKHLNVRILGIIENMSGAIFGEGGGENAARKYNVPFLGRIPMDARIVKAGDSGRPFILEDSDSKKSFNSIVENLLKELQSSTNLK
ncbi:MAG: P-loop NTPase, partial [Thermoplasmata archaeon]